MVDPEVAQGFLLNPLLVFKYRMKMIYCGLSETKVFHFHRKLKKHKIKSLKRTLPPPPPPPLFIWTHFPEILDPPVQQCLPVNILNIISHNLHLLMLKQGFLDLKAYHRNLCIKFYTKKHFYKLYHGTKLTKKKKNINTTLRIQGISNTEITF